MEAPPQPPELWNFAVVILLGAIMIWSARLMQLMLTFLDVRYAVSADAVLALRDLGASVSVLENASMWHLQQLLRAKVETSAFPMRRVTLPFHLHAPSLAVARAPTGPGEPAAAVSLSFALRSDVPVTAQVLWGVSADALQRASTPSGSSRFAPPVLERVSTQGAWRAIRALPLLFSRVRRQRRRHKLRDDTAAEDDDAEGAREPSEQRQSSSVLDPKCSRSQSELHRFAATERAHVCVSIPSCAFETPPEEVQSLLRETDDSEPVDLAPQAPAFPRVRPAEPCFAAVIVLRSAQPPVVAASPRWRGSRSPSSPREETVVAQCIAIDLLPTPVKPERFSAVVAKTLNFTSSGACVVSQDAAQLFAATSAAGSVVYVLLLLSYAHVPTVKAQHPAASLVVWHMGCGLMAALGFLAAFASPDSASSWHCSALGAYTQFWALAGCLWYLMLAVDLFVALVNPWMGYSCKAWAYHFLVWTTSAAAAGVAYQQRLTGLSSLNVCWLRRTSDPLAVNRAYWALFFVEVLAAFALSLAVLVFASFRFVRRQLDVTYRAKRRILLQYYRYLLVFGGFWGASAALYSAAYGQRFHGAMARRIETALGLVLGSYPVGLAVAWVLNTELFQNRSSEHSLTTAERVASQAEHFGDALRNDLMRYTTAGIRCSLRDAGAGADPNRSPPPPAPLQSRPRLASFGSFGGIGSGGVVLLDDSDDGVNVYREKKRLAATVFNGERRYYEKLGFTDYAPRVFHSIREACGVATDAYERSFAGTLLERATEGKSGMLFYFTSDRRYLVKTMTKREHSFLLQILPRYHQYVLQQRNSLLCRFLGCHSMQLPVGWNKMFFVVMENVFSDGVVDERYDLKGIFDQAAMAPPRPALRHRQGQVLAYDSQDRLALDVDQGDGDGDGPERRPETEPLLARQRRASRSSLRHDSDFVTLSAPLKVNATTRANLLAQITTDCGFLQELGIMDYSFLLGIQQHAAPVPARELARLAHNAVVSEDQTRVYYLGFVDILQHYNLGWQLQHWALSTVLDKRTITALPPAEYALRFLSFIHAHLLTAPSAPNIRSYGSVDMDA
ncbi:hypothetical protein ATCC90586_007497 [Pythium insidiosum]|nr:hypothetical protein ATCC90586_007497 [Pythium insidiosum]